jgi:hypothetical protein
MKFRLGIVLLIAVFLSPPIIRAQVPVGRWEIVHTRGDNSAQVGFPGSFSVFLKADGTGHTYGSFTSSVCVIDAESYNIVPTWAALGGNQFQITIAVNNLGLGPNFSFIYTGTFDASTPVPGTTSLFIPAITGTYYPVGDASGCSLATQSVPGDFVATFFPTISSGTASGALDGFSAVNGAAFDSTVNATITFTAPPAPGQIAGTVSLSPNPTLHGNACFATSGVVVNPLTINPNLSSQSGAAEYMFAEGLDPGGVLTTLVLEGSSSNLYNTNDGNPFAIQITSTEWAVFAAIGEDNPSVGLAGVKDDGTNTNIVVLYGVIGGVCIDAGGVDAPFHFISGTPIVHKHKKHHRRSNKAISNRERGQSEGD